MPDEMTLQSVPGFDTFLEHEKKTLWVFSHIGIIPKNLESFESFQ